MSQLFNKFYLSESNKALHNMLTRTINSGHLCHAYLFYGEDGIGKGTFATNFAAAIFCNGDGSVRPCMECKSCKKLISGNHPDITIIDEKDATAAIHIETMRELRSDAYIKPNDSEYKIYIIKDAQNMSIGAVNSLLKVLEEPPKTAIFIFTAKSKSELLPTLVSRCINHAIYPMSASECGSALVATFPDKTASEITLAAELSGGIIGRAVSILTGDGYTSLIATRNSILAGIIAANEYEILKAISPTKVDGEYVTNLARELLVTTRNAVLHKLGIINLQDKLVFAFAALITMQDADNLNRLFEDIIKKAYSNVNANLLCNMLCAELTKIIIV